MNSQAPAFQYYPKDFIALSACLGASRWLFFGLLSQMWLTETQCSIKDDDEMILIHLDCSNEEWQKLKYRAVKTGLLVVYDGQLVSPYLTESLQKQAERREKLRLNGLKGGRPRKISIEENQEKPIGLQNKPNETLSSSSSNKNIYKEENKEIQNTEECTLENVTLFFREKDMFSDCEFQAQRFINHYNNKINNPDWNWTLSAANWTAFVHKKQVKAKKAPVANIDCVQKTLSTAYIPVPKLTEEEIKRNLILSRQVRDELAARGSIQIRRAS